MSKIKYNSGIGALAFAKQNGIAIADFSKINEIENFWPSFTGYDFTGSNDSLPDEDLFNLLFGTPTIQSNTLSLQTYPIQRLDGLFKISGDFDYQIDLNVGTPSSTNGWAFYFDFYSSANDRIQTSIVVDSSSSPYYRFGGKSWVGGSIVEEFSTTDLTTTSKLRLVRSSSTMQAFVYDSSPGWQNIHERSGFTTDSGIVRIRTSAWTGNPNVTATMDNFLINSGTVVYPI